MILMNSSSKKRSKRSIFEKLRENRFKRLKNRLQWKEKEAELKTKMQKNSHSLLWVWEFSKKAVLICFIFYVVVQVYSMVIMVKYCDFTYLGELINQTGQIVQNCVFAYLIKAGIENVGKIFHPQEPDEYIDDSDEPVG